MMLAVDPNRLGAPSGRSSSAHPLVVVAAHESAAEDELKLLDGPAAGEDAELKLLGGAGAGPVDDEVAPLSGRGGAGPVLTARRLLEMLSTPTFLIIIAQGIVGSTPWQALVFLTLYLQLLGFSDATASGLVALFMAGSAAGSLLGGWLGDRVAERHPNHGRILLVQFSVVSGLPLMVLLLRGMPLEATPNSAAAYGTLLVLTGLLISWAAPACNNPVFAEVVPADMRNLIYAFDRSFEGGPPGRGGAGRAAG
ncbi:hypothetical protein TSOC_006380, partial [Tetrabaena socialis]